MIARHIALAGLMLCAAIPATADAQRPSIETETLQLAWNADSPVPDTWNIRTTPDDHEAGWRSLLTRNDHNDALSRHLSVATPGFGTIDWQAEPVSPGTVTMAGRTADEHLAIRQTFAATEDDYRLHLTLEIENVSDRPADIGGFGLTLGPGLGEMSDEGLGIATSLYSFVEAIGLADGEIRLPASPAAEGSRALDELDQPDWLGLYSRYFALLVRPHQPSDIVETRLEGPGNDRDTTLPDRYLPQLLMRLEADTLAAGETRRWAFTVFSGPRSRDAVNAGQTTFNEVLFPGLWQWMRWLCFGLLWVLEILFALIPSWGMAIIALAVLVRLAMYPLARRALAGQHAFAEIQRKIQPEIREIKKRYKGGEQSERILKLYEAHNVSPLAGLKPLLIVLVQIPIFVALFHVLGQVYELRDAPFLWIDTLAEPDRLFGFGTELPFFGAWFNLLPVLLAVTTLLTLKLSPAPAADRKAERRQNLFLGVMALGFFLIFYPFPSGMVLYWTTANLLHVAQSRITGTARTSA